MSSGNTYTTNIMTAYFARNTERCITPQQTDTATENTKAEATYVRSARLFIFARKMQSMKKQLRSTYGTTM